MDFSLLNNNDSEQHESTNNRFLSNPNFSLPDFSSMNKNNNDDDDTQGDSIENIHQYFNSRNTINNVHKNRNSLYFSRNKLQGKINQILNEHVDEIYDEVMENRDDFIKFNSFIENSRLVKNLKKTIKNISSELSKKNKEISRLNQVISEMIDNNSTHINVPVFTQNKKENLDNLMTSDKIKRIHLEIHEKDKDAFLDVEDNEVAEIFCNINSISKSEETVDTSEEENPEPADNTPNFVTKVASNELESGEKVEKESELEETVEAEAVEEQEEAVEEQEESVEEEAVEEQEEQEESVEEEAVEEQEESVEEEEAEEAEEEEAEAEESVEEEEDTVEEDEEETVEEEASDEEEVEEYDINGKTYYITDENDGYIYECCEDDDVGEERIGKMKNGQAIFYSQ